MRFNGPFQILYEGLTLTEVDLEKDRAQRRGTAILLGIGYQKFTPELAIRSLLYETTPVVITPDPASPLVLKTEFRNFPYTIHSARGGRIYRSLSDFACFALRFVPQSGRILSLELEGERHIAVNGFRIRVEQQMVEACFGNGSLQFELYFAPIQVALGELVPPASYKPEVTINDEDVID